MKLIFIKLSAVMLSVLLIFCLCSCTNDNIGDNTEPSEEAATSDIVATEQIEIPTEPATVEVPTEAPTTDVLGSLSIEQLLNDSYFQGICCYTSGILYVEYISSDNTDFLLAYCEMDESESDAFFDLDFFDDNYNQNCIDFFSAYADNIAFKSLNCFVPDQAGLNEYIGFTFEAFEEAGFEQTGLGMDEYDDLFLEYSDGQYVIAVFPNDKVNSISELFDMGFDVATIGKVDFINFSDISEFVNEVEVLV